MSVGPTFQSLSTLLQNWRKPEMRKTIMNSIDAFNKTSSHSSSIGGEGGDPASSSNLPDDLAHLCDILKDKEGATDEDLYQRIVQLFHTMIRKPNNRKQLVGAQPGVPVAVVDCIKLCSRYKYVDAMRTAMLCLLRICGQGHMENKIVACDTVPSLLRAVEFCNRDPTAQGAAASCLQLIGETSMGRDDIRHHKGVSVLVSLLYHPTETVATRAMSALHELTADLKICADLCNVGGAHVIVAILQGRPSSTLTRMAAGIIQNVSRNKDCIHVVQSAKAVEVISPLLIDDDSAVQCSAVGALLNLHSGDAESREQLKRVISLTIVESALQGFDLDLLTSLFDGGDREDSPSKGNEKGETKASQSTDSHPSNFRIPAPPTLDLQQQPTPTQGFNNTSSSSPLNSAKRLRSSTNNTNPLRQSAGNSPRRHIDVVQ